MRLVKMVGFAALFATAVPAIAALPPYYQRAEEIKAIMEDSAIANALDKRPIDSISHVGEDIYELRAGTCRMTVRLRDVPGDHPPGPRQFTVHAGQPVCAKAK